MSMLSWLWVARHEASEEKPPPDEGNPQPKRWLPVIDRDSCIGCERCVTACEHSCLEMVWSFATLTEPGTCTGEGRCTEACPQQIIRMDWVAEPKEPAPSG